MSFETFEVGAPPEKSCGEYALDEGAKLRREGKDVTHQTHDYGFFFPFIGWRTIHRRREYTFSGEPTEVESLEIKCNEWLAFPKTDPLKTFEKIKGELRDAPSDPAVEKRRYGDCPCAESSSAIFVKKIRPVVPGPETQKLFLGDDRLVFLKKQGFAFLAPDACPLDAAAEVPALGLVGVFTDLGKTPADVWHPLAGDAALQNTQKFMEYRDAHEMSIAREYARLVAEKWAPPKTPTTDTPDDQKLGRKTCGCEPTPLEKNDEASVSELFRLIFYKLCDCDRVCLEDLGLGLRSFADTVSDEGSYEGPVFRTRLYVKHSDKLALALGYVDEPDDWIPYMKAYANTLFAWVKDLTCTKKQSFYDLDDVLSELEVGSKTKMFNVG